MAAAGQFVRERIPLACTVPEAGRLVIELVGTSQDSHAETAGPMTFRVVRRYRPTWATVIGFLIAPLFVRRTEGCRIAVIEARAGAELLIEGDIDRELHDALVHLGRVPEAARVSTLGPRPVPQALASNAPAAAGESPQGRFSGFRPTDAEQPAVYLAESHREQPEPVQDRELPPLLPVNGEYARPIGAESVSGVAALRSAPAFQPSLPSAGGSRASGNGAGGHTTLAAPATEIMAVRPAQVQVRVDSGEESVVGPLLLVGRAPSRKERESHAKLLTVDDPSLSVSKTHLAIGVDPAGLWIIDRQSTNGTWIDDGSGEVQRIPSNTRTSVPAGARVLIGERVLTFS